MVAALGGGDRTRSGCTGRVRAGADEVKERSVLSMCDTIPRLMQPKQIMIHKDTRGRVPRLIKIQNTKICVTYT